MRLKLKTIANKPNCLGFIVKDINTNLYYTQHNNDMYFIFQEVADFGDIEVKNVIKKINVSDDKFIYQLQDENLTNFDLTTYEQAIEEFKQDI